MKEETREILDGPMAEYHTCNNGCGTLLTETYVSAKGGTCPDCRREVGSKVWWALWGPGRATKGL